MNYLACPNLLMFAVKVSQLVKLRIMSAVIPIPLYHPLRLAQDIAFADVLSGGRTGDRSRARGLRSRV